MNCLALRTRSADETRLLGETLGRLLRPGDVLALSGELGAGKTMLVQGLARGLGCDPSVPVTSPTFVLMHEYPGPVPLFHFDFYRLAREEDVVGLAADEYFEGEGVSAVEWSEKFPAWFGDALWVRLARVTEDERRVEVSAGPKWDDRLAKIFSALVSAGLSEDR